MLGGGPPFFWEEQSPLSRQRHRPGGAGLPVAAVAPARGVAAPPLSGLGPPPWPRRRPARRARRRPSVVGAGPPAFAFCRLYYFIKSYH